MEISDPSKRSCDIPSCPSLDRKVSPQLAKLDQVWSHFPVLSLLFMFSDMYCNINNMYVFIIYIFRYEYMLQLVMNTVYMQHWPKSISYL